MPLAENIMGGGISAGSARAIAGNSRNATVSAAGTTQATATTVKADVVITSTVAASSGIILPMVPQGTMVVYNSGANTLTIYPPVGGKINSVATNGGISLATNTAIMFTWISGTQIIANLSA